MLVNALPHQHGAHSTPPWFTPKKKIIFFLCARRRESCSRMSIKRMPIANMAKRAIVFVVFSFSLNAYVTYNKHLNQSTFFPNKKIPTAIKKVP